MNLQIEPQPAKRMTIWRELKWLLAVYLLEWTFDLTEDEMTLEMCEAFGKLADAFGHDPKWETVTMRRRAKA